MSNSIEIRQRSIQPQSELAPSEHATVHADKGLLAIDYTTGTVTLTLLNMHFVPMPRPD
jgi:hypothetical protein